MNPQSPATATAFGHISPKLVEHRDVLIAAGRTRVVGSDCGDHHVEAGECDLVSGDLAKVGPRFTARGKSKSGRRATGIPRTSRARLLKLADVEPTALKAKAKEQCRPRRDMRRDMAEVENVSFVTSMS